MPLSLRHVFAKDFNISLFVSFCLLGLYHYLPETVAAYDQSGLYRLTLIPAFNGFLTGAVMLLLNHYFPTGATPPFTTPKTRANFCSWPSWPAIADI